jgi:hypothetical protein
MFIAEQIYSVLKELNDRNMPYNMQIMNSAVLIIPRKHMKEANNPDIFSPAMFEFFGCFRIN